MCITQGQSPLHVAVGSYAAVEALRPDDALVLRMQEALAAFLPLLLRCRVSKIQHVHVPHYFGTWLQGDCFMGISNIKNVLKLHLTLSGLQSLDS